MGMNVHDLGGNIEAVNVLCVVSVDCGNLLNSVRICLLYSNPSFERLILWKTTSFDRPPFSCTDAIVIYT